MPKRAERFLYPARMKSLKGGRDSGKSHFVAQAMLLRMAGLLPAYEPIPVRILSGRDFETNLDVSVKVAVDHYIDKWRPMPDGEFESLSNEIRFHGSRKNPASGSKMIFHGVSRKVDSFLSMEAIDIFWMEQAEVLQNEMITVEPTIRKAGSELWFVWNPNLRTDYCWKRFEITPQPGDVHVHFTYRDNKWLSEESKNMIEFYRETEPDLFEWMYEGHPNDGDGALKVLSRRALDACIEAFKKGLAPSGSSEMCAAGLDLGYGGRDPCAEVIRVGPVISKVDRWPGNSDDHGPSAQRAIDSGSGYPVKVLYYDSTGGAGMRAEIMRRNENAFSVRPVGFGDAVNGPDVMYEPGRPNKMVFSRLNIQMADVLRVRANRTVRLLSGADIDPELCLFIDPACCDGLRGYDLEAFLGVLGQPTRRISPTTHKWEIDKTGGGGDSPNEFDAACLAFYDDTRRHRAM